MGADLPRKKKSSPSLAGELKPENLGSSENACGASGREKIGLVS